MRLKDFLYWTTKEQKSGETPEKIYDDLATKNIYDSTINYANRVKQLSRVFSELNIKPKNILDLACGTGALIDALPWKNSAKIIGLDISAEMLRLAKGRFKGSQNIRFRKESILDLHLRNKAFDLITIAYATRFIPHGQEKIFAKNISKLLKPTGKFIVFSDGAFLEPSLVLDKLGMGPKSYNLKLNYHQYIARAFSDAFVLERLIKIQTIPGIYANTALIFALRPH